MCWKSTPSARAWTRNFAPWGLMPTAPPKLSAPCRTFLEQHARALRPAQPGGALLACHAKAGQSLHHVPGQPKPGGRDANADQVGPGRQWQRSEVAVQVLRARLRRDIMPAVRRHEGGDRLQPLVED